MNVVVIAEDDRNDRFVVLPIIQAMFRKLRRPNARVKIHPIRNGGWETVKQWRLLRDIIESYPQVDLFLFCVDRDGHEQRRQILDTLEHRAREILKPSRAFFAVLAAQEIEVWALAGIDWRLKRDWAWSSIRDERDPKEHYFEPIARRRRLLDSVGQGRKILGDEAARNYSRVRQNCPELRDLEDRIRAWLPGFPAS
jgi:hypothetical protein